MVYVYIYVHFSWCILDQINYRSPGVYRFYIFLLPKMSECVDLKKVLAGKRSWRWCEGERWSRRWRERDRDEEKKGAKQTREFDKWIRKGSTFWRICRNLAPKEEWLYTSSQMRGTTYVYYVPNKYGSIFTSLYVPIFFFFFFRVASVCESELMPVAEN